MKKILRKLSFLGASVICLTLAACQGSSDSSGSLTDKTVTIDFWHTFGQKVASALSDHIDNFQRLVKENEGVDVNVVLSYKGGYRDIPQMITTAFASGDSPTLAISYPDSISDYIVAEGGEPGKYVVNMQKFVDDEKLTFGTDSYLDDFQGEDDFIHAYIDEGRHYTRDGMYSLPLMKSTEIMLYNLGCVERVLPFYNEEVYAPAHNGEGLLPGKISEYMNTISWDDLMALAKCIVDHKADICPQLDVPVYYDSDSNLFISKLLQNKIGYSSIDPTAKKGRIDFAEGENRINAEALVTKWRDECAQGLLTTKGAKGEYGSNYFKGEETIFTIGSSGGSGYSFPEADSIKVGVARVPVDNDNPLYITQGPCVTMLTHPGLKKEEAKLKQIYAWKLLKYLTSTEVNVQLCCNGSEGYLPVRASSYTSESYNEYMDVPEGNDQDYLYQYVAKCVTNVINNRYLVTPVFPGSASLRNQCGGIVTNALKNAGDSISKIFDDAINNAKLDIK